MIALLRMIGWELRQHLRDPLTLVFMVGIPLFLYPLIGFGAQRLQALDEARTEARVVEVAVDGVLDLPASVTVTRTRDPARLVEEGKVDAAVRIRDDGATVWFDSRETASQSARTRIDAALETARIPRIVIEDVLTEAQRQIEMIARILPVILVTTILMGGLYTSLDIVTGEKERGTIETLLTTSADRRTVFASKFLIVLGFNLLSAALALIAGWASLRWFTDLDASPGTAVAAFVLFLPIATILAVLLTVAAAWVPDFKTGQVLSVPILLLPALAAAAALFPDTELTWAWAIVPLSNLSIGLRDVLVDRISVGPLALAFVSSTVYAVTALAWGARMLGREDVLLGTRGPTARRVRGDYRADAVVTVGIALLLVWFLGQSSQAWNLVAGLAFTQIALLLPVGLGAVLWVGLPPRSTLSWTRPTLRNLGLSVALGFCLPGVGLSVQAAQDPFLQIPLGAFDELFNQDAPLPLVLLVFAVLPGICEEILFRGAVLGLLRRGGGTWGPVLLTAFAFGVIHLSIFRFFPTGVLGIFLGLATVRSGSIVCSMVAHAVNNGLFMVASVYVTDVAFDWWAPVLAIGAVGVVTAMRPR